MGACDGGGAERMIMQPMKWLRTSWHPDLCLMSAGREKRADRRGDVSTRMRHSRKTSPHSGPVETRHRHGDRRPGVSDPCAARVTAPPPSLPSPNTPDVPARRTHVHPGIARLDALVQASLAPASSRLDLLRRTLRTLRGLVRRAEEERNTGTRNERKSMMIAERVSPPMKLGSMPHSPP